MRFLRTNTACRITVGPFFDKTDGVTPETALTVTSCKLTFMVDDGNVPTLVIDAAPTASGGNNDMVHVTGDDAGFYDLELTAANTNYLGRAMLAITDAATHCPIFHEFMILPAVVYDAMVLSTDNLQVDTVQVTGTAQTARDLGASVLVSSGTGTGQISLSSGLVTLAGVTHTGAVIPTVTTTTTATNVTTVNGLAAGVITAASIAADAITDAKVASDVTIASVTGAVGSVTGAVGSVTGNVGGNVTGSVGSIATGGIAAASFAAGAIDAAAIATDAIGADEISAAAVTKIQTGLSTLTQTQVSGGAYALDSPSFAFNAALDFTTTQKAATLARVTLVDTTTTNTDMRGTDSAALAATALSTVQWTNTLATNLGTTNTTVASIGATGTGLTAIPWNAAWDAEVQSEVNDGLVAFGASTVTTAQVNTEVDTALADIHLDHLLATTYDPASKPGAADALLNEIIGSDAGVSQFTANALELAPTDGSAPTAVQIRQEMDSNSTQLAAIVADTNELQTDWVNGGRLDLILDARSSQTSVDDLPTNAELATALGTADDATLAAIAALNNLSAGQVRTELATELGRIDAAVTSRMATYTQPTGFLAATFPLNLASTTNITTAAGCAVSSIGADVITAASLAADAVTEIQSGLASAANLATANIALAKLDDTVEDNAGTFRFTTASLVNAPSGSGLDAAGTRAALGMASPNLDTQLSAIVTDTNELQADWVNGGRLDLILDARSSQTSVDDLPTNTELATALGTADDAVLAAIAALNDITAGEVRTELATELARIDVATSTRATPAQVATELGTYDAPTNAEMVAAFTEIKGATWTTADTLEAIRDRGDSAWLTATGFSTHSAADVRTELAVELARIDAAVSTRATPAQVATELATYDGPTNAEMVAAIDALPTAAENAAALMDLADGIETSITPRQAMRLILAAAAGELSGAATTTITIRNVGDTKDRITATVDSSGNRSSVVVDGT